jgi:hypothetical protein
VVTGEVWGPAAAADVDTRGVKVVVDRPLHAESATPSTLYVFVLYHTTAAAARTMDEWTDLWGGPGGGAVPGTLYIVSYHEYLAPPES